MRPFDDTDPEELEDLNQLLADFYLDETGDKELARRVYETFSGREKYLYAPACLFALKVLYPGRWMDVLQLHHPEWREISRTSWKLLGDRGVLPNTGGFNAHLRKNGRVRGVVSQPLPGGDTSGEGYRLGFVPFPVLPHCEVCMEDGNLCPTIINCRALDGVRYIGELTPTGRPGSAIEIPVEGTTPAARLGNMELVLYPGLGSRAKHHGKPYLHIQKFGGIFLEPNQVYKTSGSHIIYFGTSRNQPEKPWVFQVVLAPSAMRVLERTEGPLSLYFFADIEDVEGEFSVGYTASFRGKVGLLDMLSKQRPYNLLDHV